MASWKLAFVGVGLLLGGCLQMTLEQAPTTAMSPRDKALLTNVPYDDKVAIPTPYQRHIVDYHRQEAAGTIVIDTDNRFLYLVQPSRKAIRYGVTVGEEAQGWSGVAKIGNMTEWPSWTPTPGERERLGPLPPFVPGGPENPMGARAMYLFANGKDTLFRIHGTNQPEYIGASISSGCIRMLNEDAIDLYNRVKVGTVVVVLEPHSGDSPINSKVALGQAQATSF
jgi:lipoprotein-anchoring transpeptidase ErfK/SrfK